MKKILTSIRSNGVKVGKFAGRKIKDGAVYLYDNREELIGKAQGTANNTRQRHINEINSYKRNLSDLNIDELENIVRDTDEPDNKRRAAKELLDT